MSRAFAQVDVFGASPYRGNPVAVVLDADGVDDTAMQQFASWTNLSETTFVLRPTPRRAILDVDPGIVEQWKYMGAPVWELDGPRIVGNIFKAKVKLGFMYGASLEDRRGLFNGELKGKQRRSYELAEGDLVDETGLQDLVRAAITRNRST